MQRKCAFSLFVAAVVGLAGCGPGPIYEWGRYEDSVRRAYSRGSVGDVSAQRQALEGEIVKTEARGRKVPPGKYAHVGYLCYVTGDKAGASRYFQAEKKAFPESARFVDQMLGRLK